MIKTLIDGETDFRESVPAAVAACRQYFMRGGREPCAIYQDYLIYTVTVDPRWNGVGLP